MAQKYMFKGMMYPLLLDAPKTASQKQLQRRGKPKGIPKHIQRIKKKDAKIFVLKRMGSVGGFFKEKTL